MSFFKHNFHDLNDAMIAEKLLDAGQCVAMSSSKNLAGLYNSYGVFQK